MARGWIHTTYRNGYWVNKVEGAARPTSVDATKAVAVERGRELARRARTEHVVHEIDDEIVEHGGPEGGLG